MKLDILGVRWTVKICEKLSHEGEPVQGLCDPLTNTISIDISFPKRTKDKERLKQVNETIYHEIAHAIFFEAGLYDLGWWSDDNEHTVIAAIAKGLAKNFPIYRRVEK